MRTTLAIDDNAYEIASVYAKARGMTLGAAVSELVLKATTAPSEPSPSPRLKRDPNGLLIFTGGKRIITTEMVKAAQEDEID